MDESVAERSAGSTWRSYGWLVLVVAALGVLADQISKIWALRVLPDDGTVAGGLGPIRLRLLRNPGAAFSMGEGTTWIFTIVAVVVVLGVIYYVLRRPIRSPWFALLLGLIAAGAVGNLIDRLFQPPGFGVGHVIDFLDYSGFFVGNVADIWVVVGAIGLAIFLWSRGDPENSEKGEMHGG